MQPKPRVLIRIAPPSLTFLFATGFGIGFIGCSGEGAGGFSGLYEADLGGGSAVLDFQGGNKVNVSLVSGKDEMTHHCIYTIADDKMRITTDEPMGAPMNLIIDGDVLKDGGGTVYKKK